MEQGYCREMVRQFMRDPDSQNDAQEVIDFSNAAVKFRLPDGGIDFGDTVLRMLDPKEKIHLPFDAIALEWHDYLDDPERGRWSRKNILLCRQTGDEIISTYAWKDTDYGEWWASHRNVRMPRVGYVAFKDGKQYSAIRFEGDSEDGYALSEGLSGSHKPLLSFLSLLACSNVAIEKICAVDARKKQTRSALPFDDYRVLTIRTGKQSSRVKFDGGISTGETRRGMREHLRRGHFVFPKKNGRKRYWRNGAVVCAGHGGVIDKSYRLAK